MCCAQLGFKVQEATARVRWSVPPGVRTPRMHCLLFVEAEGEEYLADVGFGGNVLTAPLKLESRDEQKTPHEDSGWSMKATASSSRRPRSTAPGRRSTPSILPTPIPPTTRWATG